MSNTASGFIPAGGQLKQTISKGSQTINQNQKIANSSSTNIQNGGDTFNNNDVGATSPSTSSSIVNQLIKPSDQVVSQSQSIKNSSPDSLNDQLGANNLNNYDQGSVNGDR